MEIEGDEKKFSFSSLTKALIERRLPELPGNTYH